MDEKRSRAVTEAFVRLHVEGLSYIGFSLGTSSVSFVAMDPHITQAKEFRTWVQLNLENIKKASQLSSQDTFEKMLNYNPEEDITPVADIGLRKSLPTAELRIVPSMYVHDDDAARRRNPLLYMQMHSGCHVEVQQMLSEEEMKIPQRQRYTEARERHHRLRCPTAH